MHFVSFSYSGDCFLQVKLSLSYVIVVQKSSTGDRSQNNFGKRKLIIKDYAISLTNTFHIVNKKSNSPTFTM